MVFAGRNVPKMKRKLTLALISGLSIGMAVSLAEARILRAQTKAGPGYVIAEVEATDPAGMQEYASKIAATLAPFRHHYVIRSSKTQSLEGEAPKGSIVVIAFDSVEKAREWYESPAYAAIRPIRQSASKSRIFLVEGVPPE
jgi:uncharacterized protein (DUF1330 family)